MGGWDSVKGAPRWRRLSYSLAGARSPAMGPGRLGFCLERALAQSHTCWRERSATNCWIWPLTEEPGVVPQEGGVTEEPGVVPRDRGCPTARGCPTGGVKGLPIKGNTEHNTDQVGDKVQGVQSRMWSRNENSLCLCKQCELWRDR